MAVGLGGEQLWLSPTVANNVNPFDDQSGQGNNGTAQGGLSTVSATGSGGAYAYDLDGVDDYIDIQGLTGQYTTGGSHSTSIWIYQDTVQNQQYFNRYQSGSGDERSEYLFAEATNSATKAGFKNSTSSYIATANGTNQSGVWYNLVTTYDHTTNTQTIYKNGVSVGSSVFPFDSSWSTNYAEVGRASISGGSVQVYSDCKMDDIRSFTRVLSQSEITHLATARGIEGRPFDGLGDEQLWLCPSLENSPNDLSGNNNNGAYQGSMGTVTDTAEGGSLAYDFDGVDDYIQTTLSDTSWRPASTPDFTISGWYKTGNKFGYCSVLDDGAVSLAQQSNLNVAKALGLAPDADASFVATPYPSSGFVWRHFLMIVEGGSIRAYEGGVLQATVPAGSSVLVNAQSYDARVGTNPNSGTPYSAARMDDIRAYNRVLTQSEITHLATSRGVLGPPGGATHYNPFKSHAFINDFQQRLR